MKKNKENILLGELIELNFRLNGAFLKAGDKITKPYNQSSARWQVMAGVMEKPATVSEIAKRMGLTRQSVQRVANLLVNEKMMTFLPNPKHKKAKLLSLTDQGEEVLLMISKSQTKWGNEIGIKIGLSSLKSAVKELKKIDSILNT